MQNIGYESKHHFFFTVLSGEGFLVNIYQINARQFYSIAWSIPNYSTEIPQKVYESVNIFNTIHEAETDAMNNIDLLYKE